jgi:paraquat-inducible protein B
MSEEVSGSKDVGKTPTAQVQTKRSFSIIWVVPIVALIIGGSLIYKSMSEKGPTIIITFENADGLEAGKTKVKFKDVEVGKVTAIDLLDDLSGVALTAEMNKDAERYMTEKTQFWVVRARVAAGEISGLGTLFSGAYIGCYPSVEGKQKRKFSGLEKPPVMTLGEPGGNFILRSETLGSLDVGSPVFYRGLKVGQVVEYNFDEATENVLLKVFINAPFHEKVREGSRFWNASGIDLTLNATGIKMDTQSLISIMLGGIAFDLPQEEKPSAQAQAKDGKTFLLYADRESSKEKSYDVKVYYMMYFDQTVRGLSPGAPVEIRGIKVGEVVKIELQYDLATKNFRVPVFVVIEPERMGALVTSNEKVLTGEKMDEEIKEGAYYRDRSSRTKMMVEKGFRAQLKTGNLLTGQLFVDLDYFPDAPPATIEEKNGYQVFPTIGTPLERIMGRVDSILKRVNELPFEKIGTNIDDAIKELNSLLKEFRAISGKVNSETIPKVNDSLDELSTTLQGISATLGPDSALSYNSREVMDELTMAIRSLKSLLDYLDRNPQALLLGKEGDKK